MEGAIEAEEMSLQKMPMICEDSCEKSSEMSFHVNKKRSGLVYTNIDEQDFLELLFATKKYFGKARKASSACWCTVWTYNEAREHSI